MTREEYTAAIELVENRLPDHLLLQVLKKGYSPGRCLFMKKALAEAIAVPSKRHVEAGEVDPDLNKMYIRQSSLFGQRARLSNQLHSCQTDRQRARVSDSIQGVQSQIMNTKRAIDKFLNTGEIVSQSESYPVPEDAYERIKKRNSMRSNISNYKKKLKQLSMLPDGHPERVKIDKYESRLMQIQIHLKHVESAIEREADNK